MGRECLSSRVHAFNWWVISCDDPVPTEWLGIFTLRTEPCGWECWSNARVIGMAQGFSPISETEFCWVISGSKWGVSKRGDEIQFPGHSYFVGRCRQIIVLRTLFGTCANMLKRDGYSDFPAVNLISNHFFLIDLSCWFGYLLIALSGFTQLPFPSSRDQGNTAGVIKSKRESGS